MKIYTCSHCGNPLYFENNKCLACGRAVGFDPQTLAMVTLPQGGGGEYAYCRNAEYGVCNWLVAAGGAGSQGRGGSPGYCVACAMNQTIPALGSDDNRRRWRNLEVAKHRLIYSLLRLKLPFGMKGPKGEEKINFNFMEDGPSGERVMTGHDNGIITINTEEADEAARAQHKAELGERYRTLLGHFRHEIGHFYWDVLIKDKPALGRYRALFGDERKDYSAALQTYYSNGAPADWPQRFVSPYATAHPWEDWAETWAHYLHMMDTLETAWAFGIRIDPAELEDETGIKANIIQDPFEMTKFDKIIRGWLPLCFAVNSLNRSMGHADFYPFVLSAPVIEKLRFIHELCHG
jgi:hypothetical protein